MQIELTELDLCAQNLGFDTERISADHLNVILIQGTTLTFKNTPNENDNAFGFLITPWHIHDKLYCHTTSGKVIELEPSLVLRALKCGDWIIVSRYLSGELQDMWLEHIHGLSELDIEPHEEIRFRRIG